MLRRCAGRNTVSGWHRALFRFGTTALVAAGRRHGTLCAVFLSMHTVSIDLPFVSADPKDRWVPLGQHLNMRQVSACTGDIPHLGLVPMSRIKLRKSPRPRVQPLPLAEISPPRAPAPAQPRVKKQPAPKSLWAWFTKWF